MLNSRLSLHLRECNHHHHYHHRQLGLGLGFRVGISLSFMVRPSATVSLLSDKRFRTTTSSSSTIDCGLAMLGCLQSNSHNAAAIPSVSDCFSQHEGDNEPPLKGLSSVAGGIVALGKFDALHIGHRELAIQAAKVGVPFLLSFVGMAEVFGWEPRAPIVAKCDRKRVLSSWAPYCGNATPIEIQIEFSKVRHLSPHQFVEKLSRELGVSGVVAGENYRFGYKAAGDASQLVKLCEEHGMRAYIINTLMDKNQDLTNIGPSNSKEQGQVSSTRVRHALARGDMIYVSELLGRQHRLVLRLNDERIVDVSKHRVSAPRSCLLNLPPTEGRYENCSLLFSEKNVVPCRVIIDTTNIHLELGAEATTCINDSSQGYRYLVIDFGDSLS